jgi:branched-chain amino acid transport system permease protein
MVRTMDKKYIFPILGGIFLLLLPVLFPRFYVYIASLILLYGLLATSLNLVIGYGGIYQFHHCVFYGAGAYGAALMLTKTGQSSTSVCSRYP